MPRHILSKSTFMYGAQCAKRLYLHKFFPELRNPQDEFQQAIFSAGTNAGLLAQELFVGGVNAEPDTPYEFQVSVQKTADFLAAGHTVIYEAAFQYNGVLCAIDLLVKLEDGWHALEVKSTNSVKEQHIRDAALQYFVITNSGLNLENIAIVHFNPEYIRRGELNVHDLFKRTSVLTPVLELQEAVTAKVGELKEIVLNRIEPQIAPGDHCFQPYDCDFTNHCGSAFPKQLPIPEEERFDPDGLSEMLGELEFPLYFFDFETIMYGVPEFDESRPYQQIPCQYSLHTLETPESEFLHAAFLGDGYIDPRPALIEHMQEHIGPVGTIIVWNKSFESGVLGKLAIDFPEHSTFLHGMQSRLFDLMLPFKRKYYRHPDFGGSSSIKRVLPVLIPELSYQNLNIQEGGTASFTYGQLQYMDEATRQQKILDLLEYCRQDTWAMVKIWQWINEKIDQ